MYNHRTICIDAGNTFTKVAVVEQGKVESVVSLPSGDTEGIVRYFASIPCAGACILSSVGITDPELKEKLSSAVPYYMELTSDTPLPIQNHYTTPDTLGKDRLAAVVGAYHLFPGKNILVIDAGTALTIDFIDHAGIYHGGNISPGLQMRFRSLHDYTNRLPLINESSDRELIGISTTSAIRAGVQNGMIFEIENYINRFCKEYPDLMTIITGGDTFFFVNKIEKPIFAEPNLIFIGLEQILKYNR